MPIVSANLHANIFQSTPEMEIKRLSKLDGNKVCADCPEKLPTYVDITHNVFVCTRCSGIHREFQFKIKGVSMSNFTDEDIAGISGMGNDAFNRIYLSKLPREYVVPNGNDVNKLKDFIRGKYVDKKWHRDSVGSSFGGGPSHGGYSSGGIGSSAPASSSFASSFSPSSNNNGGFGNFDDPFGDNAAASSSNNNPNVAAAQHAAAQAHTSLPPQASQPDRISIKLKGTNVSILLSCVD